MGRKKEKSNKSGSVPVGNNDWILVDPSRVRFQHSRIRPNFSGCGRSVVQTVIDIQEGITKPEDLPPIQVIIGPVGDDGERWYFSLNNRRLWVLKRCREEGLLENNLIRVRVRAPKSSAESERYTLQNCALEAKFIRETGTKSKQEAATKEKVIETIKRDVSGACNNGIDIVNDEEVSEQNSNPFNILM